MVYMDDIAIGPETPEEHMNITANTMSAASAYYFKLSQLDSISNSSIIGSTFCASST